MNLASIGKVLASQAMEGTKNTVMAAINNPEPPKPADPKPETIGSIILGQIQAMQRPLTCEQELLVTVRAGEEMLRVIEIFVPSAAVLVFSGLDPRGNVTRVISPVDSAQVICKIVRVEPQLTAVRVNILTPKPRQESAA